MGHNFEIERQMLIGKIDILEMNVADLEKMLHAAYERLREAHDQLNSCIIELESATLSNKGDE